MTILGVGVNGRNTLPDCAEDNTGACSEGTDCTAVPRSALLPPPPAPRPPPPADLAFEIKLTTSTARLRTKVGTGLHTRCRGEGTETEETGKRGGKVVGRRDKR